MHLDEHAIEIDLRKFGERGRYALDLHLQLFKVVP